jgi:hypothetical protein
MPSAPKPPRPTCPALNLCLDFRQRNDGTLDLLGVFNALTVPIFPLRLHLHVHYVLLDGQGRYVMQMGAAADDDEHAQRTVPHEVVLRNPHHTHDAVVTLDMILSAPGLYWVRLYANDDMVAHRGFAVSHEAPKPSVANR